MVWDVCFQVWWYKGSNPFFCSNQEKVTFSRHWTWGNKQMQFWWTRNRQMSPVIGHVYSLEREFSGYNTGRRNWEPGKLHDLKREGWVSRRTNAVRMYWTDYQREESCIGTELQRSVDGSLQILSRILICAHLWGNYLRLGREPSERIEGVVPGSHIGPRTLSPALQGRNLKFMGHLQSSFASLVGNS